MERRTSHAHAGHPEAKVLQTIGWREWVTLPSLGGCRVKAKIDTGARSSSLHAFFVREFSKDGCPWVRFTIHPKQRDSHQAVVVEAPLLEHRWVKDSGGRAQLRPVIETSVRLGPEEWTIEVTLARRDVMGFRMLLGRQALRNRFTVDPARSYLLGKRTKNSSKANE
ncbi:MAG: hypothetical protein AKCLJLPJ_01031 [Fimbriimonadales bacterium]|nr:hypothetical protein [Fimbriimonadales bacterium]